jgi:hypothetical protein
MKRLGFLLGKKLTGEDFHLFMDALVAELPDYILRDTIQNSVKSLVNQVLTDELLKETCWRLSGNVEQLLEQKPVASWVSQIAYEWVPVQICEIQVRRHGRKLGVQLVFQSLAGSIVPRKLVQVWSFKKLRYLASFRNAKGYGFGFRRSSIDSRGQQRNKRLFEHANQFYGLRCFILLDPKRSNDEPQGFELGHNSATTKHNTLILDARDRAQTPCLKKLEGEPACYHCPFGTDRCLLATRRLTYKRGTCLKCGKPGLFDPEEIEFLSMCVSCVEEARKL